MAKAPTAKRYAQALFAIAEEKNAAEAWLDELTKAQEALDDRDVRVYLDTPRVRAEAKLGVVAELMKGREPMVANLVGLLASRQGVNTVGAVAEEYGELLNQKLGRCTYVGMTMREDRIHQALGNGSHVCVEHHNGFMKVAFGRRSRQ